MSTALYAAQTVRQSLGACLRPGGLELTRHALELAGAALEDRILDAGCGPGGTLGYLRERGFSHVMGLDKSRELLRQAKESGAFLLHGSLDSLPVRSCSLDIVLCECVLNLAGDPAATLAEFRRMLVPKGRLVVSDIFMRRDVNAEWPVASCFARARTLQGMRELFECAGFELLHLEEHTRMLKETAARLVFEHGSLAGFWETVTGCGQTAEQAVCAARVQMPGLFLAVVVPQAD